MAFRHPERRRSRSRRIFLFPGKSLPYFTVTVTMGIRLRWRADPAFLPDRCSKSPESDVLQKTPHAFRHNLTVIKMEVGLSEDHQLVFSVVITASGNVQPVLFRKGGIMAGVMKKAKYPEYTLTLSPGDAVFVYTDGAPEANDAAGEMYGMERLEATLNRSAGLDPEELLGAVRLDVDAFVGNALQFDDLTMLCLTYRGPSFAKEGTT